jgi:hypothetical protein
VRRVEAGQGRSRQSRGRVEAVGGKAAGCGGGRRAWQRQGKVGKVGGTEVESEANEPEEGSSCRWLL